MDDSPDPSDRSAHAYTCLLGVRLKMGIYGLLELLEQGKPILIARRDQLSRTYAL